MTIVQYREHDDHFLYADWKVQEFRSVDRFSDYQKIKARLQQDDVVLGTRRPERHMWFSDHMLTIVIAATGIILVLLAVVSILIAL
jgi:hypothetical protein